MDREHKKRVETVKLLITEAIMVMVIIVTAIILTFVAMGYNLDKNGELGQSGLVQLRSFPSGASITIDGDTILPKTTTSRMLTAGEHTIKLSKEGYDTWEKKVVSEPGRLLKLEYMRLYYKDRIAEEVKGYDENYTQFIATPNRDYAMLVLKGSNIWKYLDLRGDDAKETEIDFTWLLNGLETQEIKWNNDSDKLLVKALRKNETEWLLINVRNPKESVNLSREFAMNFSDVRFMSENGDKLVILENGNLRTIMLGGKTVSQVLASSVKKFSFVGDYIAYIDSAQKVGMINGDKSVIVKEYDVNSLVNVALSDYIGDKYLTITDNDKMTIYKGELPSTERTLDDMEVVLDAQIGFVPAELNIYGNNELIIACDSRKLAVYDSEARQLSQFEIDSDSMFFVDGYNIGEIIDDQLFVMDFDGANKRHLTSASSSAVITRNNKWLYYIRVDNDKAGLWREKIVE